MHDVAPRDDDPVPDGGALTVAAGAAADLQELLLASADLDQFLRYLVRYAAGFVGGDLACGLVIYRDGHLFSVADSDPVAARIDEAQYHDGDGPCLHALRTGAEILIADLAADERWPAFRTATLGHGVRASLSVPFDTGNPAAGNPAAGNPEAGDRPVGNLPAVSPLVANLLAANLLAANLLAGDLPAGDLPAGVRPAGDRPCVGALNLYARDAHAFGPDGRARARHLVNQVSPVLALALRLARQAEFTDQLQAALASRAVIDQALGIIMAQNRCDADQAFEILRTASQNRNTKLRAIAAEIVTAVSGKPPRPVRPVTPPASPFKEPRTGQRRSRPRTRGDKPS